MSSTTFKLIPKSLCKQKPALMRLWDDERIYEYAANNRYIKHLTFNISPLQNAYVCRLFRQSR